MEFRTVHMLAPYNICSVQIYVWIIEQEPHIFCEDRTSLLRFTLWIFFIQKLIITGLEGEQM